MGFAVVGLGKEYDRACEIQRTAGADLRAVVDTQGDRAKKVGQFRGTIYKSGRDGRPVQLSEVA